MDAKALRHEVVNPSSKPAEHFGRSLYRQVRVNDKREVVESPSKPVERVGRSMYRRAHASNQGRGPRPSWRPAAHVGRSLCRRAYASIPKDVEHSKEGTRRRVLQGSAASLMLLTARRSVAADEGPVVRLDLAPDQSKYDPADEGLRDAAYLLQKALNAESVQEEEKLWTQLITKYKDADAIWKADVVGRAFGNRGNARSRQGKMDEALADFDEAIKLCPWSVDPLLNRGVVYEAIGRYEDAVMDYKAVLKAAPNDPSGWNNLGNVRMAQGAWKEAADYYGRAYRLAPQFSFAAANQSLALYQQGKTKEAVREMRTLLRRFPDFPDMRAALAAASWRTGDVGEAENNWARVEDPRYSDLTWLARWRRWPPRIRDDLENFLKLRATYD